MHGCWRGLGRCGQDGGKEQGGAAVIVVHEPSVTAPAPAAQTMQADR